MDTLGQSAFLVAVTSLALGASVAARNLRNKVYLAFGVLCALIFTWALSFFLHELTDREMFYRLHLVAHVWLAPAGIALVRGIVRVRDGLSRRLMDLAVGAATALMVALVLQLDREPWVRSAVLLAPAFLVAQMFRLMWLDRRARLPRPARPRPEKRPAVGLDPGRRAIIYLGALFVLCTSLMDHVPAAGRTLPALGNLALTVYLFFVSQALTQQRLLNIEALISRFLVLLAISLLLTGVYSLLFAWIKNRPALFLLNSFIISFLLVVLLDPLRSLVRTMTQKLVPHRQRLLVGLIRDAQIRLAGLTDLRSFADTLLRTVDQLLGPDRASLYLLSADATRFERARSLQFHPPAPDERPPTTAPLQDLLADHPLLEHCVELHRRGELPVLLDQVVENEIERSASRTQRERLAALAQALRALEANLLIPLFDGSRPLGFVAIAAAAPPAPWGNNWGALQVVYPFFDQAAQTLRNMEIFARQREKERLAALGEMAAGLAHEIRNPLGAIKGAAQFLEPDGDRPDGRFLRVIVEEVDRLNRVVGQFLEYSKPAPQEVEEFELSRLVERAVEALRPGLADPSVIGLELRARSVRLRGAPVQIQQLLVNLVQNAERAVSGRPSPRVVVRVSVATVDAAPSAVIEVEDNGRGIPPAHMARIFIPFFTTSTGGTGLGLSICQKIAENHGGRIEAASEEGRYTRFTVVLPLAAQQEQGE
ncbi:MAG: hypothetical protein IT285_08475 [Bdellovibrionales bacterium]|nr:hypothetical protein [Bdellovibrionales bacterium]